jgi:hypothetical protein
VFPAREGGCPCSKHSEPFLTPGHACRRSRPRPMSAKCSRTLSGATISIVSANPANCRANHQPERVHRPRRGAPVTPAVVQFDLDTIDDRVLERLEMLRWRGLRMVPSRRVPDDGPGGSFGVGAKGRREGAHQLADRGPHLGGGGTGPGDEEERPGLVSGEPAQIGPCATDRLPPSPGGRAGSTRGHRPWRGPRGPGGPCARSPRALPRDRRRSPDPWPAGRGGQRRGGRRARVESAAQSGQKMASFVAQHGVSPQANAGTGRQKGR